MRQRGEWGHIIHVSSLSGHRVPVGAGAGSFYAATKHAVRALTEGLRQEVGLEVKLMGACHFGVMSCGPEWEPQMCVSTTCDARAPVARISCVFFCKSAVSHFGVISIYCDGKMQTWMKTSKRCWLCESHRLRDCNEPLIESRCHSFHHHLTAPRESRSWGCSILAKVPFGCANMHSTR